MKILITILFLLLTNTNSLLQVKQSKLKHYYLITIPTTVSTMDGILELIGDEEVIIGDGTISYGKYLYFDEAVFYYKRFKEYHSGAFIVAQFTDDSITDYEKGMLLRLQIELMVRK